MHITPLAGLRFRLPCENKNLSANADATVRRGVALSCDRGERFFAPTNII
ncbi:MAG: hypothetical protein LBU34_14405 [Planctomycetaceae bacterium]|nr:hypothetical protein [Planctomycetaceae bacterium]